HGFNTQNFEDYISSQDVANAGAGAGLAGSLTFTIGCHAGLSVPDRAAVPPEAGLPVDASLDLAQAMARQRAVFVANTGFGLGDSETVAGNEELMAIFAEELARGGTAGTALRLAKQRYFLGLASLTVYEEKASVTTTFYGLPQYVAEPVAAGAGATIATSAQTQALAPTGTEVTVLDGAGQSVVSSPLTEHVTDKGSFYSAHGVQATAGRPLQPRLGATLPEDETAGPVHGVVVLGGTYTDLDPFDPVIAQPQQEWQVLVDELQACAPSFWPSVFAAVNSLPTPEGLLQNLVVIPAQFRCTSGEDVTTAGVERLFDTLVLGLRRSTSDDFAPPVVNSGGLSIVESSAGLATVTVDASDESGIAEIVVYVIGGGIVTSHTTGPLSGTGPFSLDVPVAPEDRLVVQVVDGAGNVASLTGKGVQFDAITVDASVVGPVAPGQPVTFTTHITGFVGALADADETWFVWDFGDGTFDGTFLAQGGTAASFVVVNPDGSATFNVTHTYGASAPDVALTRVVVTDDAGRVGTDAVDLQLCGDGTTGPNTNGEPMPLPKPIPAWDDATNPAGDTEPDICDEDIDGDGLTNSDEVARGLSAFIWDTDGDRTADGVEVACGSNPLSAVSNLAGADTDADGLPDACETIFGTHPGDSDSDDDAVRDGVEVRYWMANPLDPNTDGDDCGDAKEIASVDANRVVNSADLGLLAAAFGQLPPEFRPYDADGNGVINSADLGFAASQFAAC
ncbi:MAG TPA: hypothetical protein VNM91_08845, partial [Dehalococcoidia bacterium]|nr:hypothetical protein [Dehalococcoidia bacterium]